MNPKEFFNGTQQERSARSTFNRLQQRVEEGKNLSAKQESELNSSQILSRNISRRRFIGGTVFVVGAGAVGGATWLLNQMNEGDLIETTVSGGIPTAPESTEIPVNVESRDGWKNMLPKDRLQVLMGRKAPEQLDGFDAIQETIKASAEFFCAQIQHIYSPEELVTRTTLVQTKEEYANLAVRYGNLQIRDPLRSVEAEKKDYADNRSSGFTTTDNNVFLNIQKIKNDVTRGISTRPDFAQESKKSDMEVSLISYILLHEYGHANQSRRDVELPRPVGLETTEGILLLHGFNGLRLKVTHPSGNISEDLLNTDEAFIDTQARKLTTQTDNKAFGFIVNGYEASVQWVSDLCELARVNSQEFGDYISGKKDMSELVTKWGGINLKDRFYKPPSTKIAFEKGMKVLGYLGLQLSGRADENSIYQYIIATLNAN